MEGYRHVAISLSRGYNIEIATSKSISPTHSFTRLNI